MAEKVDLLRRYLRFITAHLHLNSVVSMANKTDITPTYASEPLFDMNDYAWMVATFVLTPLTAAALAVTGYIQTDPVVAAVSGLLVSFMYVGFRVINAWRRFRLYRKTLEKKPDEIIISE